MPESIYHLYPKMAKIRAELSQFYRIDETIWINQLIEEANIDDSAEDISNLSKKLVEKVRLLQQSKGGVNALMHEFSLSSTEGVVLMCLAEALLRIPDKFTSEKLIRDKISKGNWQSHLGHTHSLFVNATIWGMVITGKIVTYNENELSSTLSKILTRVGEPLIHKCVCVAMRILGKQFVTGETIHSAIKNGAKRFKQGYRYSYDMLGEAAFTAEDAERYFNDYVNAIHVVGKSAKGAGVYNSSGVSVKLSAIHPRYTILQHQRVMDELYPRLKALILLAKYYDIGLNIDAEESERLEISLDLMDKLLSDEDLAGFDGIGFVVQAYQKRAPLVINYLIEKARENQRKLMVRLVKGAYWDAEIKRAQTDGMDNYPVYSRKVHTDISYIACAKRLLAAQDVIYPQFATHNAQTLSTIYHLSKGKNFEFQCLYGMGETLYDQVVGEHNLNVKCRVYAPVGSYQTLLAYLVRRLLENGANTSFVNQIVDENIAIETLIQDPVKLAKNTNGTMHPKVPLPAKIFGDVRLNSRGYDITDYQKLLDLESQLNLLSLSNYKAYPQLGDGKYTSENKRYVKNPAQLSQTIGEVIDSSVTDVERALVFAVQAKEKWKLTPVRERALILAKMADLMEHNVVLLLDLAIREAGKTLNNAIAEVREAIDFCRYYAQQAVSTQLELDPPRGIIVAISPWNFPLAIFVGEVSSALVTGNVVLAKPAEQTSLMAKYAVELFYQAGIPQDVLQCLPGNGKEIGERLVSDPRINGVIFTGSTATARTINHCLQNRVDIVPLVAETGGQNAMIVDSSALAEQVVSDVINSAFDSAGQRCSALRVLYIQNDVADNIIHMLKGTMAQLRIGRPQFLTTDVGPVIDKSAQMRLLTHIDEMKKIAKYCYQIPVEQTLLNEGIFVPPTLFEIEHINQLKQEVFGPILHVIRFRASELSTVIADINSTGFGLTSGIHSRINATIELWNEKIRAGNLYVNRNTVGAVVGVQPFGGIGLSGTGPKAGGPLYLQRLVSRQQWKGDFDCQSTLDLNPLRTEIKNFLPDERQEQLLDLISKFELCSPLGKSLLLNGITGEKNTLSFVPYSAIAIGNGSFIAQIQAFIAVVACGAKAIVKSNSELASALNFSSQYLVITEDFNDHPDIGIMIVLDPLSIDEKLHYAKRQGAILTYVDNLNLALSLLPLVHEKSLSINTSAAGGNATLMAEID